MFIIWTDGSVAMEPDLGGQEKNTSLRDPGNQVPVAMEPDLGGQEKQR